MSAKEVIPSIVTAIGETNGNNKIRIAGIDAPEKRQPFGDRSKTSLSALHWRTTELPRRTAGRLTVTGATFVSFSSAVKISA